MNELDVLEVMREGVWTMLKVSTPIMMIALIVGLAISLIQALTQIQEMTLVFVPKILAVFLGLLLLFPFMLDTLQGLATVMFDRIASLS